MLTRWVLKLVPGRWGDSIEGDVEEARHRRRQAGLPAGQLWELGFCTSIVLRVLVDEILHWLAQLSPGQKGVTVMSGFGFEMRQALRSLARSRATTILAIAILALTIGFSTAVFSVADGVLFKPLPYPAPDRLVELRFTTPQMGVSGLSLTGEELASARASASLFEQVEAFNISGVVSRIDGPEPERLRAARITPGLLSLLGARLIGEAFQPEHAAGNGAAVAILTYHYWRTRMGADPGVVGSLLRIDGEPPLRIIGILDESFVFPSSTRSLLPHLLRPMPEAWLQGDSRVATAIGRLRPGGQAADVPAVVPADSLVRSRPGVRIFAIPLHERLAYSARRGLTVLFVGVLTLLVIGMLDVAGLLLVKATAREREIVTRRALGASSGRIARQVLLEALLLAIAGGALGLVAARVGFTALLQLVPEQFRLLRVDGIDVRAVLFATTVMLVTALIFGLAPLAHLRRLTGVPLRAGAGQSPRAAVRRVSNAIVIVQVAAAFGLVVGGVLLVSSFVRLRQAPTGFDASALAFVSVTPPPSLIATRGDLYRTALERLRGIPGVHSAAMVDVPALRSIVRGTSLSPASRRVPGSDRAVSDTQLVVTADYFRTAGLDLLDGRLFTAEDGPMASQLAVVNEALAKLWFPGERAVGQRLVNPVEDRLIIGVVESARHFSLKEEPLAEIFLLDHPAKPMGAGTFVIRADEPHAILAPAVSALRALAPTLPITAAETGAAAVGNAIAAERFYATLLTVSSSAGLLLALIGLYAVLAWSVGSRRRELGLRAALGAGRPRLAIQVGAEAVPIIVAGCTLGAVLGWWSGRLATALLYEVRPGDGLSWLIALGIVLAASSAAVVVPCRRAFRTDPASVLREEL